MKEAITRITRLHIENVRGFAGSHTIPLDADIVLLTGANGFGKTSLIDAINLVLNGGDPRITAALCHSGCRRGKVVASVRQEAEGPEAELFCTVEGEKLEVTAEASEAPPALRSLASVFYQHDVETSLEDSRRGRASPLYQFLSPRNLDFLTALGLLDRAAARLEQEKKSWMLPGVEREEEIQVDRIQAVTTLKEVWARSREQVVDLPESSRLAELDPGAPDLWKPALRRLADELLATLGERVDANADALECLLELRKGVDALLSRWESSQRALPSPLYLESTWEPFSMETELRVLRRRAPRLDLAEDELGLPLDSAVERLIQERIQKWRVRAKDASAERYKLVSYQRRLKGLSGIDLDQVLEALATDGWSTWSWKGGTFPDEPEPKFFRDLLISIEDFSVRVRDEFHAQFMQWKRSLMDKIDALSGEIETLERRLLLQETVARIGRALRETPAAAEVLADLRKRSRTTIAALRRGVFPRQSGGGVGGSADAVEDLRRAVHAWIAIEERQKERDQGLSLFSGYAAARDLLDEAIQILNQELSSEGALTLSLEVPQAHVRSLEDSLNQIIRRFRWVEGILPIQLKKQSGQGWSQHAESGIGHGSLSTGQQSLIVMATTLALNLLFEDLLPHRVVLLDDVTTSLDLGQLTRSAILFRQLAYGSGLNAQESRRQLILSSHHEDMTNRLLDFLMPPPGCRLRIVRFEGWSRSDGPQLRHLRIDGESAAKNADLAFQKDVIRLFEESLRISSL